MNTHVFLITAKTNLHVGNESGGDFSIIDKAIQRDPLTGLPCINSSSLKGAINEFCSKSPDSSLKNDKELRKKLFGSDKTGESKDSQKGTAIFFDAKLLYLPQQPNPDEDIEKPYILNTSETVIKLMNDRVRLFAPEFEYEREQEAKQISHELFKSICNDDNLPIIARNVLDNGESKNLWYEQVLPAETVLYTIIREEKDKVVGDENGDKLAEALNGKIVQIGANATIGYGYCEFKLYKTIKEKEG